MCPRRELHAFAFAVSCLAAWVLSSLNAGYPERKVLLTTAARADGRAWARIDGALQRVNGGVEVVDACGNSWVLRDGDALERSRCVRPGRLAPDELAVLGVRLDVNLCDEEDLTSLPGIGPALAHRIVAGRPFETTDELLRVRGIGPKTLANIAPRLVPPTIHLNRVLP